MDGGRWPVGGLAVPFESASESLTATEHRSSVSESLLLHSAWPGPPSLPSQLPALGREVNGHSYGMFCSLQLAISIYGSNHEQR